MTLQYKWKQLLCVCMYTYTHTHTHITQTYKHITYMHTHTHTHTHTHNTHTLNKIITWSERLPFKLPAILSLKRLYSQLNKESEVKRYIAVIATKLYLNLMHLAPPWNVISRWPISKEHPDAFTVGCPPLSTPTTTLTERDTLLTDTSQLPWSETWGL